DQPGVELRELRIGDAEALGLVAAQVVERGVGRAYQRVQHALRARMLQVQRQALLVAVEGLEEMAVTVGEEVWADRAGDVAALPRVLDLDALGAEVGQHHAAERAGAVLLDGDDAQTCERKHGSVTILSIR